jgi:hypothetical protein
LKGDFFFLSIRDRRKWVIFIFSLSVSYGISMVENCKVCGWKFIKTARKAGLDDHV